MKSVIQSLPLPNLYYLPSGHSYFTRDEEGKWIKVNETSARLWIRNSGYSETKTKGLSEAEQCFLDIQCKQNVSYAGKLAGYNAGFYHINGNKILVTESPRLIIPEPGSCPLISTILDGMLNTAPLDQRPYFYGWLKRSLESYYSGKWMQGQVIAFAGPRGAAKSLLQSLLTEMFGGRSSKPYLFMTGRTTFNSDLFEGEHLVIDDEAELVDIRARRHVAAFIKQVAVTKSQHCHGKNKTGLILTPLWRMTISLNDDPERMLVLPPITSDIADKLMVFKVERRDMPMPTGTADEKEQFWNALMAELPAFISDMLNYEIPPDLQCPRYGVTHYHHPDLLIALNETAPEMVLLEIIDQAARLNANIYGFEKTASEIQALLRENNTLSRQADQLLRYSQSCGNYLTRLAGIPGTRVSKRILNGTARYTINQPDS